MTANRSSNPAVGGTSQEESWVQGAIGRFVQSRSSEQAGFLSQLVRSPSDNPPGDCAAHAKLAARLLEGLGFEVERHPVPEAQVQAVGMRSVTNLVVRRRYGEGPVIALNAHGDVVPPGEGWSRDPYGAEIVDGWMYGRGVAVSKSDFATYAYAVLALEASDRPSRGTVELHFTWDEEAGGEIGPAWLLASGLSRPDMAICAGFSYSVVNAHNGCLHLEVTVRGRQAHAAMPHTGIDALEAATAILSALYEHRSELATRRSACPGIATPTLTVGLIQGGINTNVVPDSVTLRLDRRMIPEEDPEEVEAELDALITGAGIRGGANITLRRLLLARPLAPLPGSERLVEVLARHARDVFSRDIPVQGVPLYTDARHYTEAGIPTVLYGAGPGSILEANAHGADERLRLDDLERATVVTALAIRTLLTGEGHAG